MLLDKPDDFAGIDAWQDATETSIEIAIPGSTLGYQLDEGRTLHTGEYALLFDIGDSPVALVGRPRQLMAFAKRIQSDLRALTGHLSLKAKQATSWCHWCLQPIEHVRVPDEQAAYWQHIVTCETTCNPPIDMKDATPILTVRPCKHCRTPVAMEPRNRNNYVHLRTRALVCNILDSHSPHAKPDTDSVWTPDMPTTTTTTTDPWETEDL